MTEGEFIGAVAELTAKVVWLKDYRQKWQLIRFYCEEALRIQAEQPKWDRAARDMLVNMVAAARIKVERIEVTVGPLEAELNRVMQEVDPDVTAAR